MRAIDRALRAWGRLSVRVATPSASLRSSTGAFGAVAAWAVAEVIAASPGAGLPGTGPISSTEVSTPAPAPRSGAASRAVECA